MMKTTIVDISTVEVSAADVAELKPHLKSWNSLNEYCAIHDPDEATVLKLIKLESEGADREFNLKRLIGRYTTHVRKNIYKQLEIKG